MNISNRYTNFFILLLFLSILITVSCRKEEIINNSPYLKLGFSADSVIFDTVFTSLGSATKQLMIYNPSDSKVVISNLILGDGEQSAYRINVDGESGDSFKDIELSGGDSIYVFVRVTIDPQNINNPYVIEDDIYLLTNGNEQKIKLIAWGQDANYILADTYIEGLPPFKIIADSLETVHWTNEKPYVIYGYAVINSYGKLIIDEGARIFFHEGSGLWAYVDGELNVLGTIENPVTFKGDRLEEQYANTPGQWDRIWLMESRVGHDHIIKNAIIITIVVVITSQKIKITKIIKTIIKIVNLIANNEIRGCW